MKIDRLLGILIYLLNREMVSAKELSKHFEVSTRTINRDMESLMMAGIPIYSQKGVNGGFGIISNYKINYQMMNFNEIFYIIKSLQGFGKTLNKNKKIDDTIEKFKAIIPNYQKDEFLNKSSKFHLDFQHIHREREKERFFADIEDAVEKERLIEIVYVNAKNEEQKRIVEPMSIVFSWSSWYLYSYCTYREDYRIFKFSRIKSIKILDINFKMRDKTYEEFCKKTYTKENNDIINLELVFKKEVRFLVEDFFKEAEKIYNENGSIKIKIAYPKGEWVYSMLLSYGDNVYVEKPDFVREELISRYKKVLNLYMT